MRLKTSNFKIFIFLFLFFITDSFALIHLKEVRIEEDLKIEFVFDGILKESQVKIDFLKNAIQWSIDNASVYPAKIIPINHHDIAKVFAYQYTPQLIRCRIFINDDFEKIKNKFSWDLNQTTMTVLWRSQGRFTNSKEDLSLIEKIKNQKLETQGESFEFRSDLEKKNKMVEPSSLPSPLLVFSQLGFVLILFVGVIFCLKKILNLSKTKNNILFKFIKKSFQSKLGNSQSMIEILSSQDLGPKKKITIVRVSGQILVLGVSHDSINLITRMNEDSEIFSSSDFTDILNGESNNIYERGGQNKSNLKTSIRDQVRSKVESLKPL